MITQSLDPDEVSRSAFSRNVSQTDRQTDDLADLINTNCRWEASEMSDVLQRVPLSISLQDRNRAHDMHLLLILSVGMT